MAAGIKVFSKPSLGRTEGTDTVGGPFFSFLLTRENVEADIHRKTSVQNIQGHAPLKNHHMPGLLLAQEERQTNAMASPKRGGPPFLP
jgi:hypothetical protein